MYTVIRCEDNSTIALVESPFYIRDNGNCFVPCSEEEAQGIALNGEAYNLLGHPGLGDYPTVHLSKEDSGRIAEEQNTQLETHREQLAQADDTAIELYEALEAQEQINKTTDDALIELYEAVAALQ